MRISIQSILAAGCDSIWHELIPKGELSGDVLTIEDHLAQPIIQQCAGQLVFIAELELKRHQVNITVRGHDKNPPIVTKAVPTSEWPVLLKAFALLATEADAGLGDMVERLVGPIGGDAFKEWHQKIFGRACGCGARKDFLNQRYPLN